MIAGYAVRRTRFAQMRAVVDEAAREAGREGAADRSALFTAIHLDHDGHKARTDATAHLDAYFGGHNTGNAANGYFGSPEEIAERLQPLVDRGLTMICARIVSNDYEGQAELIQKDVLPKLQARPLGARGGPQCLDSLTVCGRGKEPEPRTGCASCVTLVPFGPEILVPPATASRAGR